MSESRTILVTGATGVVGSQLVNHFLDKGDRVVAAAYDDIPGVESLATLGSASDRNRLHTISLDLEDDNALTTLLAYLNENQLNPAGLVHAARNLSHLKLSECNRPTRDGWLGEFRLDVMIAYDLVMSLLDRPRAQLESVVAISSMYGVVPPTPRLYSDFERESPIHYGVVKAAQIHLAKELAVRLAARKVRVNTVSLGGVAGRANKAFMERYAELCPLGRMLEPHEVVGAVDFLMSSASSAVTGHNLTVDGGWTVW